MTPTTPEVGKLKEQIARMNKGLFTLLMAGACAALLATASCNRNKSNDTSGDSFSDMGTGGTTASGGALNFVGAARLVTPGVVHVRTLYQQAGSADPLDALLGPSQGGSSIARGSGSGVTLTADGYIATNNHVVEGASRIEVVFPDRRSYEARLVGRDPGTDLALLKVDGKGLPTVKMGNSDKVQVGEWVLAVGYPFSLNTTATAGIISA